MEKSTFERNALDEIEAVIQAAHKRGELSREGYAAWQGARGLLGLHAGQDEGSDLEQAEGSEVKSIDTIAMELLDSDPAALLDDNNELLPRFANVFAEREDLYIYSEYDDDGKFMEYHLLGDYSVPDKWSEVERDLSRVEPDTMRSCVRQLARTRKDLIKYRAEREAKEREAAERKAKEREAAERKAIEREKNAGH